MRSSGKSIFVTLGLALAAAATYSPPPVVRAQGFQPTVVSERGSVPAKGPVSPEQRAARLDWLRTRGTRRTHFPAPGWSVAQDRRKARKARNVRRNRSAHRG